MLYAQEKHTILITKKSKDQLYKFPYAIDRCKRLWCTTAKRRKGGGLMPKVALPMLFPELRLHQYIANGNLYR